MLINCSRNVFVTTQRRVAINRPATYFKLVTKGSGQSFLYNLQMKRKGRWTVFPVGPFLGCRPTLCPRFAGELERCPRCACFLITIRARSRSAPLLSHIQGDAVPQRPKCSLFCEVPWGVLPAFPSVKTLNTCPASTCPSVSFLWESRAG